MDKLAELIANAAQVLGLQAERIWPQIVYVTWIRSMCMLALTVLVYAITALFIWCVALKLKEEDASENVTLMMALIVGGFGMAIAVMFVSSALPDTISGVLAPEAVTVLHMVGR